jgi:hypothetical protein
MYDACHRTTAYVASEEEEPMLIWAFWDPSGKGIEHVDNNQRGRTTSGQMEALDGEKYTNILAAGARLVWDWKHENLYSSKAGLLPDTVESRMLVELYPDLRDSANKVGAAAKHLMLPTSQQAFIHFMMGLEKPAAADQFLLECRDDEQAEKTNPARLLSTTIARLRRTGRGTVPRRLSLALAIRAANTYMAGKTTNALKVPVNLTTENFPDISWIEPMAFDIGDLEVERPNIKTIMDRAREMGMGFAVSKGGKLIIRNRKASKRFAKQLEAANKQAVAILREERAAK